MKIFLLVLYLLAPGVAWSADAGSKVDLPAMTPAKGDNRVMFTVNRAAWPGAAKVTIDIVLSNDGGATWEAKPSCRTTTTGGVILNEKGIANTHTTLECPLGGEPQNANRRAKAVVTSTGAAIEPPPLDATIKTKAK